MGQLAPDFTVKTVGAGAEKDLKLSEHKGKVVLIDFWATWCGPCRMISPTVEELYQKYHGQGFEVVAVSDEQEKTLKVHRSLVKTKYPIYRDFAGMANGAYKIEALPTQVLIGRNGKIVWTLTGADPDQLKKAVDAAMSS